MNPTALEEILGKATADTITDQDILFGRGGFTNNHAGNIEYLKLLSEHEEAYMDCKRKYQKLLSLCIIHQLRCKVSLVAAQLSATCNDLSSPFHYRSLSAGSPILKERREDWQMDDCQIVPMPLEDFPKIARTCPFHQA